MSETLGDPDPVAGTGQHHRLDPPQAVVPPELEHLDVPLRRRRPVPTMAMAAVTFLFALGLFGQPSRWLATPAYGNLMDALTPPVWGLAYLAAAVSLMLSLWLRRRQWIVLATHMWPVILLIWWELAFIIRWATDTKTTIVNVVSWGTYLSLVVWSAVLSDDDRGRHP